jgi:diguanylate cyclase (GGDEF)-like protein
MTVREIAETKENDQLWEQDAVQIASDKASDSAGGAEVMLGLSARSGFERALRDSTLAARITGGTLSVIMVEIDNLRLYADTYGRAASEECIRRVGDLLRSQLTRANDLMVRWSMEAFMVLLPGANLENSKAIADAMLNGVRALRFEHDASPHGILTVSIGVTVSNLVSLADPTLLPQQAERAVSVSREAGKNCVTVNRVPSHMDDPLPAHARPGEPTAAVSPEPAPAV